MLLSTGNRFLLQRLLLLLLLQKLLLPFFLILFFSLWQLLLLSFHASTRANTPRVFYSRRLLAFPLQVHRLGLIGEAQKPLLEWVDRVQMNLQLLFDLLLKCVLGRLVTTQRLIHIVTILWKIFSGDHRQRYRWDIGGCQDMWLRPEVRCVCQRFIIAISNNKKTITINNSNSYYNCF